MIGWPASDSLWMLARRYHEERCQNRLAAASASDWVASSEPFVACPRRASRPGRRVGYVGLEVGPVERLGHRPDALGPEAQRLALVVAEVVRPATAE